MERFPLLQRVLKLCPYHQIGQIINLLRREGRLPDSAKPGAFIALMGLCCPLFWGALWLGVSRNELLFHASHSALVCLLGLFLMGQAVLRSSQQKQNSPERSPTQRLPKDAVSNADRSDPTAR
ncbi:hypothetical protein [Ferrimonas pelagia]|uniref:hypothetical protein n=1 Tax=Ferrimonas pelagia TaxID=1177826 RepID=UPI0031F037BD